MEVDGVLAGDNVADGGSLSLAGGLLGLLGGGHLDGVVLDVRVVKEPINRKCDKQLDLRCVVWEFQIGQCAVPGMKAAMSCVAIATALLAAG